MKFYEHVSEHRVFNKLDIVNYTAGYLDFMPTLGSETETGSWQDSYLCSDQIDHKLVNELKDEGFALEKEDRFHRSAAVRYNYIRNSHSVFRKGHAQAQE